MKGCPEHLSPVAVLPEPASWTNEDVAHALGKDVRWVRNNVGMLGIPRYKIGRQYRYRPAEVMGWVTKQTASAR